MRVVITAVFTPVCTPWINFLFSFSVFTLLNVLLCVCVVYKCLFKEKLKPCHIHCLHTHAVHSNTHSVYTNTLVCVTHMSCLSKVNEGRQRSSVFPESSAARHMTRIPHAWVSLCFFPSPILRGQRPHTHSGRWLAWPWTVSSRGQENVAAVWLRDPSPCLEGLRIKMEELIQMGRVVWNLKLDVKKKFLVQ